MKKKHKIVSFVAGAMAVGSVIAPSFAFAQSATGTTQTEQSQTQTQPQSRGGGKMHGIFTKGEMVARAGRGVSGTVTAISGKIITMTDKKNVTYTVDVTNAKFGGEGMGMNNPLTLANILVGDRITVRGTTTGTNIVALDVSDKSYFDRTVFSGKVTAVSGSTITLVKNKTTTYTVDVGSATLTKGFGKNAKAIVATDVVVGDRLTVVGTLSGSNVHATSGQDMGAHKGGAMGMLGNMMGGHKVKGA